MPKSETPMLNPGISNLPGRSAGVLPRIWAVSEAGKPRFYLGFGGFQNDV